MGVLVMCFTYAMQWSAPHTRKTGQHQKLYVRLRGPCGGQHKVKKLWLCLTLYPRRAADSTCALLVKVPPTPSLPTCRWRNRFVKLSGGARASDLQSDETCQVRSRRDRSS
eukprot:6186986-Pleurochrysis_carterae.AAC.4